MEGKAWWVWVVMVAICAIGIAYGVVLLQFPIERAWFLLALLGILALLPFARRITEISAFGITAKLREEVKKAEDALAVLRGMAKVIAGNMLREMSTGHYLTNPVSRIYDKLEARTRLLKMLREIGLSDPEITEIDASGRVQISFFLHDAIRQVARQALPNEVAEAFHKEFDNLRDIERLRIATVTAMKQVIEKYQALNPDTVRWLNEYERFQCGEELSSPRDLSQIIS